MDGGGPINGGGGERQAGTPDEPSPSLYLGFRHPPSPGRNGRERLEAELTDAVTATTSFRLRRVTAFTDRPYAFVEFWNPRDAADARKQLHGSMLLGQEVTVRFADPARKFARPGGQAPTRGGAPPPPGGFRPRSRSRSRSHSRSRSRSRSRSPRSPRRYSRHRNSPSPPRGRGPAPMQQQQQQQQPMHGRRRSPSPMRGRPQPMPMHEQPPAPRPEPEPLSPPPVQQDVWRGVLCKGPTEVCNVIISAPNGGPVRSLLPEGVLRIETRSSLADLQLFVSRRQPLATVTIICDEADESRRSKYAELRSWLSNKNVTGNVKLPDGKVFYVIASGADVANLPPATPECLLCGIVA